jgi:hypothetical protein
MSKNRFVLDTIEGIKIIYPDGREVPITELPEREDEKEEGRQDEIGEANQERIASPSILEADPDAMS